MLSLPAKNDQAQEGGMYLATKGVTYYSHSRSNLQTIQCEDESMHWQYSCDKAVSGAIPIAATVHHSQRPEWQA